MNNPYYKNFGIYLGGAMLVSILLPYLGIHFGVLLTFPLLIAGTILSVVMTAKDLGKRIEFGPAVGAALLSYGVLFVLSWLVSIIMYGMPPMWYVMEFVILQLITQLAIIIGILLWTGVWYAYQKAGKEGWECIVPIYNFIVLLDIAKKPTWWIAMLFVPIANIIFLIMALNGVSKNFGKSEGFTVGLVFMYQIFMAVLGYGSATYVDAPGGGPSSSDLLDN